MPYGWGLLVVLPLLELCQVDADCKLAGVVPCACVCRARIVCMAVLECNIPRTGMDAAAANLVPGACACMRMPYLARQTCLDAGCDEERHCLADQVAPRVPAVTSVSAHGPVFARAV